MNVLFRSDRRVFSLLMLAVACICLSCGPDSGSSDKGLAGPDIDEAFWGRWAQVGSQKFWYFSEKRITRDMLPSGYETIAPASANATAIRLEDGTTLSYESAKSIKGVDVQGKSFLLYKAQNQNGSFTGKVKKQGSGGKFLQSAAGVSLVIQNVLNSADVISGISTSGDGEFTVNGAKIGDSYSISVRGEEEVVVTPENEGSDVGVYTMSSRPTSLKAGFDVVRSGSNAYYPFAFYEDSLAGTLYFTNYGSADLSSLAYSIQSQPGPLPSPARPSPAPSPASGRGTRRACPFPAFPFDPIPPADSDYADRTILTYAKDGAGTEWEDSVSLRLYRQKASIAAIGLDDQAGKKLPVAFLLDPEGQGIFVDPNFALPYRSAPYLLLVSASEDGDKAGWYYSIAAKASGRAYASLLVDLIDTATGTYDASLSALDPAAAAILDGIKANGGGGFDAASARLIESGGLVLGYVKPGETRYYSIDLAHTAAGASESVLFLPASIRSGYYSDVYKGIRVPPIPAGSEAYIGFQIRNDGNVAITSLKARLSSANPYVAVDAAKEFGGWMQMELSAGSPLVPGAYYNTGSLGGGLSFTVAANCPADTEAELVVDFYDDSGAAEVRVGSGTVSIRLNGS